MSCPFALALAPAKALGRIFRALLKCTLLCGKLKLWLGGNFLIRKSNRYDILKNFTLRCFIEDDFQPEEQVALKHPALQLVAICMAFCTNYGIAAEQHHLMKRAMAISHHHRNNDAIGLVRFLLKPLVNVMLYTT